MAVGASAGGVEALTTLAAGLPDDLPYAVLVVLHMPPNAPSVLPRILDRAGPLRAVAAVDGTTLEAGRIYVAVPNRHLLVRDHRIMLSEGPTESMNRPAVNALFRSVAVDFGPAPSVWSCPGCSTTACWVPAPSGQGAASPSRSRPTMRSSPPCRRTRSTPG
ncbi:hypothetical protein NIIDNTM18_43510 [Mycolicibacterium litorale]|uniref:protein-glutamate methylesterase n=1 Tax=Mycolicibacterium litorale TaxID=758802 RepID=A0A6S6P5D4_9MYCO|nr:hypothetical protein NIIDNTM18_43510 [Mycolicibacterium litorale]